MPKRRLAIGLTIVALLLAACGGSGEDADIGIDDGESPIDGPPLQTPDFGPTLAPTAMPPEFAAALLAQANIPAYDPIQWQAATLADATPVSPVISISQQNTYAPGDVQTFNVIVEGEGGQTIHAGTVDAELIYINGSVVVWLELGANANRGALRNSADIFAQSIVPQVSAIMGREWSPGVDGDPRIHILHVQNLPGTEGMFTATNQYPASVEPLSNQREMFYVSLSALTPGSEAYLSTLAHEYQHLVAWNNDPNEATWLDEGLAQLAERIAGYDTLTSGNLYLANTATPLTGWSYDPPAWGSHYGAAYLFNLYMWERFGDETISRIAHHPAGGMQAIDAALVEQGVTAREVFGDWAVANLVDNPSLASGRYGYQLTSLRPACPQAHLVNRSSPFEATVDPYSVRYLTVSAEGPVTLDFAGNSATPLIDAQAHSGNALWWSNRLDRSSATLTRYFDLSNTSHPHLSYWTWFDIQQPYDRAYVMISDNAGQNWHFLRGAAMQASEGQYDQPAYTGLSVTGDSVAAQWLEESIDLSAYAGREVLVRFEYVTDTAVTAAGWALDDVAIAEIGFSDDIEWGESGWVSNGFVRTSNAVPQHWDLRLVEYGPGGVVQDVRPVQVGPDGTARITIDFDANLTTAKLVVAASAPATGLPGHFSVTHSGAALTPVTQSLSATGAFADDFSDPCSGWTIQDGSHTSSGYANGQMVLEVRQPNISSLSSPGVAYQDVSMSVDVVALDVFPGSRAGVVCRMANLENFYLFEITSGGFHSISRRLGGDWSILRGPVFSPLIHRGQGAANRVSASCVGETLTLWVNEQQASQVTDGQLTFGDVGLSITSGPGRVAQYSFDNFAASQP